LSELRQYVVETLAALPRCAPRSLQREIIERVALKQKGSKIFGKPGQRRRRD
jgi:hypothetical protein